MDNDYKMKLLESGLFKKTSGNNQYRMRDCYFCGDNKYHFYVRIDMNSNDPIVFNCFKCNLGDEKRNHILNKEFLEYHNLDHIKIPRITTKKIYSSKPSTDIPQLEVIQTDHTDMICSYIEHRVGTKPTLQELQLFQFIADPMKYAREYLGGKLSMLSGRAWFRLTNGNIKGRLFHDNGIRWMNYYTKKELQKGLYTIKKPFDLSKQVTVIIAEGIMDVIGLYYNYPCDNALFIATLSSSYRSGLDYLISIGIFGTFIHIKFFKDSDAKDIKIDKYRKQLFGKIEMYRNVLGKDYGVLPSQLEIEKIL